MMHLFIKKINTIVFLLILFVLIANTRERADIIVSKDGSGDFTTIQAAIDAIPLNVERYWIILVKNGTYNEKIFLNKSKVCIVGENRDSTVIIYAELRRIWREKNPNDWGAAVVNIGNDVTDVILANLTIYNNYGSLYNDHDHQFAIRSGGKSNRIIILNCNVWADGGDTVSLWNDSSGMYYHANCYFKGWVDYVCPRGWCYITDSKFYGYNLTASIWHDGKNDSTMKFVIRNSTFDGIQNFRLGRHHHDAQFYLLDCKFSEAMKDTPIYFARDDSVYKWGKRTYFWNCQRAGGNYSWLENNLTDVYEGEVHESQVNAFWTFAGRWDPERTMPAVLPFASIPYPRNNEYSVIPDSVTLHWVGGRNAVSYKLYFGSENPPEFISDLDDNFYTVRNLKPDKKYFWKIDVVNEDNIIAGELWNFSTKSTNNNYLK